MAKKKQLVAGIDVGTTKICSTCARTENNEIEILGTGWAPSRGLKKGIVVNVDKHQKSEKPQPILSSFVRSIFSAMHVLMDVRFLLLIPMFAFNGYAYGFYFGSLTKRVGESLI